MKTREIRQMTSEEILNALEDQKEALFNLRFQKAFGQLEDSNSIRRAKRDVARVLTVIRERQLQAQEEGNNG